MNMNEQALDTLIRCYAQHMDTLYGDAHDELFKWRALKTFRDVWFQDGYADFTSRFEAATKDFSVLVDNRRMHPRNAVMKLCERAPAEVERLFCDVLFAPDGGDLKRRQEHMDAFVDGMERLRIAHYPGNWSFKQDRHTASVYLAMYAPSENYIYKHSEASDMAQRAEYGFAIGSGEHFELGKYYAMCDEIVARLRMYPELLEEHFAFLRADDRCAQEQSLHLLAYDLIYCCRTYGYYREIPYVPKQRPVRCTKAAAQQAEAEAKRQAQIEALLAQLEEQRAQLPDVSDISLCDVAVTSGRYGDGMVIEQDRNKIRVAFADVTKTYILDAQYPQHPTFENDAEVVAVYTQYARIRAQIRKLEQQLKRLGVEMHDPGGDL